jgi:hypothetical protein
MTPDPANCSNCINCTNPITSCRRNLVYNSTTIVSPADNLKEQPAFKSTIQIVFRDVNVVSPPEVQMFETISYISQRTLENGCSSKLTALGMEGICDK